MHANPLDYRISDLNRFDPLKGRLLVSEPFLPDPYFKRSVVLLIEHNDEGSVGLILNKPLNINLNETFQDFPNFEHEIYMGGPVQASDLFYLHTLGDVIEGSERITDDLYWGGNFESVKNLLSTDTVSNEELKFFIGYSGWEKGQLLRELEEDSWLVTEAPTQSIMSRDIKNLWRVILKDMGDQESLMADFPEDPSLN